MDTGTIIIVAVFAAICIIPFFLFGREGRKQRKALTDRLNELAQRHGAGITAHEVWKDYAIGLDESSRQLFFISSADDRPELAIRLEGCKECRMNHATRQVSVNGSKRTVTERISLSLMGKAAPNSTTTITFYDADHTLMLADELLIAHRWEQKVNDAIRGRVN